MLKGTMHAVPGSVTERTNLVAIIVCGEDPDAESGRIRDQVTGSSDVVTGRGEDIHGLRLPSVTKLTPMTYRLAADAWDYTQIPGSFNARDRIVLGYDNWPAAAWARFPQAKKVRIATAAASHGLQYCVLDVEAGDATIAQAPGWIAEQHRIGALWPTIYIQESNLDQLRAACHGLSYWIWLAWWAREPRSCA